MNKSENFENFINSKRVNSTYYTHVSMGEPFGKFQIDRKCIEEFWELYIEEATKGGDGAASFGGEGPKDASSLGGDYNNELGYCIAEKPGHYLPVLVDVDLKIIETCELNKDKLYTEDQLNIVVKLYQSVLKEIIDSVSDDELMCVVLEKEMYRIKVGEINYLKGGFHLHFPSIFLNRADQEIHLLCRIKTQMKRIDVFKNLGYEDSGSVIDGGYCSSPWLIYGCRKKENMKPYLITKIISSNGTCLDLETAFINYKIYNVREEVIQIRGNVKKYIPRILSIIPYGRSSCEIKEGLAIPSTNRNQENIKVAAERSNRHKVEPWGGNIICQKTLDEKIKEAKILVSMLNKSRAEDRNEWIVIGWILYNIFEGDEEGLYIWNDFSSNSDKYNEVFNTAEWRKMSKQNFTIGTLKYFASVDSPSEYNEYKKNISKICTDDAISGAHHDIAKILFSEFGNEFVCASIANKTWYQYIGHQWEEIEEGVFLRRKISNEIVSKFEEFKKDSKVKAAGENDFFQKEDKTVKKIFSIISNLKTAPFKSNVMKECAELFYDKNFKYRLDINPNTIAFKNGVYDLITNVLRIGVPEDYISTSLPIDYIEYNELSNEVIAVNSFLEKVFPDKTIRDYFLDTSADVFMGGNKQKIVLFWTGEGDNGKSVTQRLFEIMLGPLAIKFSTTLITGKKTGTGTANPELARAGGGVRWAVLEEPDGDEAINIGMLKSLSGNDSYWARDLFQSGKSTREITPMFKLIFICNKLPSLKYSDKAVWNRIRVIPFESTFIRAGDQCPETEEEQLREKKFPMDNDLYSKIPAMVQAFAWILLNHRKNNLNKVRIEPYKVLQATQAYRNQNDVYRQYMEECLIEVENKKIGVTELYADVKLWLRDGFPGHPQPSRADIVTYFDKALGKQQFGNWNGYMRRKDYNPDIETAPI